MEYVFYIRFTRGAVDGDLDKSNHVCELSAATNIFSGQVDDDDLIAVRGENNSVSICMLRGSREDCEQAAREQYSVDLPNLIDTFVSRCCEPNIHELLANEEIKQTLMSYLNNIFNCYPADHFADNRFMEFRRIVNRHFPEQRGYRRLLPEEEGAIGAIGGAVGGAPKENNW